MSHPTTDPVDPCPGSTRLPSSWLVWHLHPVRCARCDHVSRCMTWSGEAHLCGACDRALALQE